MTMGDILQRKCRKCKKVIEIDVDNIKDVAMRDQYSYYHKSCLLDMAAEKLQSKRSKCQVWQDIIDNIEKYESAARDTLSNYVARDKLNQYLLTVYDVITIPDKFFQVVADLSNGKYKQKRCNPVKTYDLLGAWKWGQKNLDKINRNNKMKGVGPTDDAQRIMYDLAIIVGKVHLYLEHKEKAKAAEIERQREMQENIKIDYSKITNNQAQTNNLQDISSLVDEIF